MWWAQASITILFLPLALVLSLSDHVEHPGWWFVLGTSLLHAAYFLFLGRAYSYADLSLVYPIARGTGPALVPILGILMLGETVSAPAIAGIATVVLGIYTVYLSGEIRHFLRDPFRLLKEPGTRYALITGLLIAAYSVWDKVGVTYVSPFLYMYLMSLGVTIGLAPFLVRVHGVKALAGELRASPLSIVVVGLMIFVAYGLILTALQFSRLSYIWPTREIGIVIGVLLGSLVLREPFGQRRILGSSLIVLGVAIIALAP